MTTYQNLRLVNKTTCKLPVFISPLLMHQHKDWKTYSKFSCTLTTEKPKLEGILACGTDGKWALMAGFKRYLQFAVFLRCFLHFKDNIKQELANWDLEEHIRHWFIQEIFGKHEGTIKYYGLVDCDSEEYM